MILLDTNLLGRMTDSTVFAMVDAIGRVSEVALKRGIWP